jgi:hypothetical protein
VTSVLALTVTARSGELRPNCAHQTTGQRRLRVATRRGGCGRMIEAMGGLAR